MDSVVWEPGVPGAEWILTVSSADGVGNPVPEVGEHTYTNGQSVVASVTSPVLVSPEAEQQLCVGWSCTGLLPASGTGTVATLVMTTHAELLWNWRTQYWLSGESGAGGTVDMNGWLDAGSNVTVTAEAYPGHSFSHWSGDLDGASFSGVSVTVTMDRPRTLIAYFIDLAEALDTTNLLWQTTGTATWAPQTTITHDGVDAGRSGVIGNEGWSRVETTVTGPGLLRFTWRVSSEKDYDWFDFLVNDTLTRMLTGESGWEPVELEVGAGIHELAWEYWKDEGGFAGADCGWLDQVSWVPDAPPPTGFTLWLTALGLSGDADALFSQDHNNDGIPNGFEYAFGTNLPENGSLLNIRIVNGRPVIETPTQDSATQPYVDVSVIGTDDLSSVDWNLPIALTADTAGKPTSRDWHEPEGPLPGKAFFKLKAKLK